MQGVYLFMFALCFLSMISPMKENGDEYNAK